LQDLFLTRTGLAINRKEIRESVEKNINLQTRIELMKRRNFIELLALGSGALVAGPVSGMASSGNEEDKGI
jgi:hypothetical protein